MSKKNEILPRSATLMNLENIMLTEVKSEKDKYSLMSLTHGISKWYKESVCKIEADSQTWKAKFWFTNG